MDTKTIDALNAASSGVTQSTKKAQSNSEVSSDEFINLLVTQLKNQDPLNPMGNEEFAVQLAQFSQLEQLVSINGKLDGSSDSSSLASYLGQEVVLPGSSVDVEAGDGGLVSFSLPQGVTNGTLELLDQNGVVRDSYELGDFDAGRHSISLDGVSLPDGTYFPHFVGEGVDGGSVEPEVQIGGIVSGFIPGPDPKLLLGNKEISPSNIQAVRIPGY